LATFSLVSAIGGLGLGFWFRMKSASTLSTPGFLQQEQTFPQRDWPGTVTPEIPDSAPTPEQPWATDDWVEDDWAQENWADGYGEEEVWDSPAVEAGLEGELEGDWAVDANAEPEGWEESWDPGSEAVTPEERFLDILEAELSPEASIGPFDSQGFNSEDPGSPAADPDPTNLNQLPESWDELEPFSEDPEFQ
jgi:hypothetical protein